MVKHDMDILIVDGIVLTFKVITAPVWLPFYIVGYIQKLVRGW